MFVYNQFRKNLSKIIYLNIMEASTSKGRKNRKHVAVSYENEDNEEVVKKKSKIAPKDWEIIYNNIKEMRKTTESAVDTMGCEQCADKNAPENVQRYQILVALMLSSQTKDQVTYSACQRLKYEVVTYKIVLNH